MLSHLSNAIYQVESSLLKKTDVVVFLVVVAMALTLGGVAFLQSAADNFLLVPVVGTIVTLTATLFLLLHFDPNRA